MSTPDRTIRIAIAGVGNCASSLVQGISFYSDSASDPTGLMQTDIGGDRVGNIEPVAAFDIDVRKVGRPLEEAIFAPPNNTNVFHRSPRSSDVIVQMGSVTLGRGKPLFPRRLTQPPLVLESVRQVGTGFAELRSRLPGR